MPTVNKEDHNGLVLIAVLNHCGRRVLYKTFRWGTPDKPCNVTLSDYLKASGKQNKFNKTQEEIIRNSPDGSMFDVSLLFLAIKLACKNVAIFHGDKWFNESSEMEYYVTAIKGMRNDVFHGPLAINDQDFIKKINKIRELLIGCLKTCGERYERDEAEVNEEIKHVNDDLNRIMQVTLVDEHLMLFCSDRIKQLMIENSRETLKKVFKNFVYVNPVSFTGVNLNLEVDKIFVDIEIKKGKCKAEGEHVDCRDLLQLVQSRKALPSTSASSQQQSTNAHSAETQQQSTDSLPSTSAALQQQCTDVLPSTRDESQQPGPSERPQILLLEGLAGSGKSTLVSMVVNDWINEGQGKIRGLDNYDLMLLVQCRDPTIHSYQLLLEKLMPDVSLKFRDLLPRLMKLCKLLIVVDGLDEVNENSRKLIESLLCEFKNISQTNFMFTSRPENLEMFRMKIPREYGVSMAELRGIPEQKVIEFMFLSHQEIVKQTESGRSTEQLVKEARTIKGFQEHFALPLNLILTTYLWDQAPEQLNLMTLTQTELYDKIHHLSCRKLLERLANDSQINDNVKDDLEDRIRVVLRNIYWIALISLSRNQLIIEKEMIDKVIESCEKQCLPKKELLSAFLSLKSTWTWEGNQKQYSTPHKGIQDFYSAVHIVMTLKCQLQSPALPVSCNLPPTLPGEPYQPHATPTSASPTSASATPASPFQATSEPAFPTPVSLTPTSPTPASPTPASPTPASPTPDSPRRTSLSLSALFPASPIPTLSASIRGQLKRIVKNVKNRLQTSDRPGSTRSTSRRASCTPGLPGSVSPGPVSCTPDSPEQASSTSCSPGPTSPACSPGPASPACSPGPASPTPGSPGSASPTPGSSVSATHVTILEVLKKSIKPAEVDMPKYQNVLMHVAGLLALIPDHMTEAPAKEVVTLLQESGMRDENHWLGLLENTKVTSVTAKAVAAVININGGIHINDSRVRSYAALLPHLQPSELYITLSGDPADLPHLPELLTNLAHHRCMQLVLNHHYNHHADITATSDDLLQQVQPRCELNEFTGRLSGVGVAALPTSLRRLCLAVVSDNQARSLLPKLHAAVSSRLTQLVYLKVSVAAEVSPAHLVPLPEVKTLSLQVCGAVDAGWSRACDVAKALQSPQGFREVEFPSAALTEAGWRNLVLGLRRRQVRMAVFRVPTSVPLTPHQDDQMRTLVKTTLACDYDRSDELLNWLSTFRS